MDGVPAYKSLADELREAIIAGEFPSDRRLPTEAELAAARGLSRQTVRQAYAQLVAESLVFRVRGRGSFATAAGHTGTYLRSFGSVEDLMALSADTELETVEPLRSRADVDAADRLQLRSDEVMEVTFRRLHDDVVFCVSRVRFPPDVGRLLSSVEFLSVPGRRSRDTMIGLLERKTPLAIAGAHQSITATAATPEVASQIDCGPGEAVLRIDRLYFDQRGKNIELATSYFNPLRYSYRLDLRRNPG